MKKITQVFCAIVLLYTQSYAQIGIGNTNPDDSAILDVTSTTQGFLAPRMSTADRTSISSPADGLMVYDTDLDAFMYFDSTWHEVANSTSVERDNYKLIKSVDDLADELTAGGGSSYQLTANTYYEINGSITLAFPIDLNEAYISGLDANEDRLVIAGGTIFSGSSGGSIRNLTLVAVGSSIFNLTGTGAETLVFQNCVVGGFGATTDTFGSITNYNIVFMNIINIGNLDDGITYTNINNLLLSNVAWFDSNAGTYETYVGSFDLLERISGFSKVPSGATGIDVSANPTIGSGNIIGVPFSGAGTHVEPYTTGSYTGYNFSNTWNVNSPGLKVENDISASADFYYTGSLTTGFVQSVNNTAAEVQGAGTFASNNLFRFTSSGGDNRLTYDGIEERQFQVNVSLSVRIIDALGNFFAFIIYKNGSPIIESNALVYVDATYGDTQIQNVAINTIVDLENGDYIEVYVDRLTGSGSDTMTVFSETLSIK